MVLVTVDLTEEANKNLRIYMANQNMIRKTDAINRVLEELSYN